MGKPLVKSPLLHLASLVFDSPLAILPEKLETILRVMGPRLALDQAAFEELCRTGVLHSHDEAGLVAFDDDEDWSSGGNGSAKRPYKLTDAGVAVIPVTGILLKRGSWMSAMSGCSAYDQIGKSVKAAMDDSAVRAILFDVNSPGGTTHGCFELCDLIHSYRGTKKMYAVSNDLAASAAYAIASAADRVFMTRTASVGSVGVFALHCEESGLDERIGVKYTYIFFGDKKTDGNPHEPLSKSAAKDIQAEVNREGDMFVEAVARNRGTTTEKILATQAGVFFANNAIPLLADEIGTYDDALAALGNKVLDNNGMLAPKVAGVDPVTIVATSEEQMPEDLKVKKADDAEEAEEGKKSEAAEEAEEGKKGEAKKGEAKKSEAKKGESRKGEAKDVPCDDEEDMESKSAVVISEMCMLAGEPALVGEFIRAGATVAEVRKSLLDRRAAKTREYTVNNHHTPSGGAQTSLDQLAAQAQQMADASDGKLTYAQAYTRLLIRNPRAYAALKEQMPDGHKDPRAASYLQALGRLPEAIGPSSIDAGMAITNLTRG